MKKLTLTCLMLLLMAGCKLKTYRTTSELVVDKQIRITEIDRRNISRWHDDELGVTCWINIPVGSISCIPDWMLEPQECE